MTPTSLEREMGVLQEKIAKLESWRSRVIDVIPLAIVLAAGIWIASTLIGMSERLARLEVGQANIERQLVEIKALLKP